jgi:WD40 repeat protein
MRYPASWASEAWAAHEALIKRFENAWREEPRPGIDDFLPENEPDRTWVLFELVHIDLEFRLRHGQPARLEDYLERYPGLEENREAFLDLIVTEFGLRRVAQAGAWPEEYLLRFPQFQNELPQRLAEGFSNLHEKAAPPALPLMDVRQRPEVPGYEILGERGRGGMGIVYEARQIGLQRTVALKMIRVGYAASPEDLGRFRREAEAIAHLDHPNIVPIYEVGEFHGCPYFTMKLYSGGSLADRIGRLADNPAACGRLVEIVARALQHAHERGMLHRDIKPSNILLDAEGRPHLVDFGLAKRFRGDAGVSFASAIVGTPGYMAPEQALGSQHVTIASDVYGLGAVLYELLTGRMPFHGDTPLSTLLIASREPVVRPTTLNPRVPLDLETICLKCLEKDPARRYPAALELAEDLKRWQAGRPILARPVSGWEQARRWCGRNPGMASMTAAVAMLLLVLGAGASFSALYLSSALKKVDSERERAQRAEQEKTDKLWESYRAQARAVRLSTQPGRRFDGLAALTEAARLRPAVSLRHDAIACMALPDLRVARQWVGRPEGTAGLAFDSLLDRYARSDQQGCISIRSTADDAELTNLPGLGQPGWLIRFSPDGRYLAVRYLDKTAKVWAISTRQAIAIEPREIFAFTPDSRQMASLDGKFIQFFDLPTGRRGKRFAVKEVKLPTCIVFDPEGRRLILAAMDNAVPIQVYDLATEKLLFVLSPQVGVRAVSWRPDGRMLAAACADLHIRLFDTDRGRPVAVLEGHEAETTEVEFHPNGQLLVSTGWDNVLCLWDTAANRLLLSSPLGDSQGFPKYQFSPDGLRLGYFADGSSRIGLWDVATGQECRVLHAHDASEKWVWDADVSRDGRLAASAHTDGIRLWDLASRRQIFHWDQKGSHAQTTRFLSDGRELLVYNTTGLLRFPISYSPEGKTAVGSPYRLLDLPDADPAGLSADATRDGERIALADRARERVIVLDKKQEKKIFVPGHTYINRVAISPDGRWIASSTWGSEQRRVRVVDMNTQEVVHEWKEDYLVAAFSPDGRRLVTGGDTCRFWDVGSWELVKELRVDPTLSKVAEMAFHPEGTFLALAQSSRVVRLVDPETGEEAARLAAPFPLQITSLRFSSDGRYLAVGCANHTICVWDLASLWKRLREMGLIGREEAARTAE